MSNHILMGAGSAIARQFMVQLGVDNNVTAMTRDSSLIDPGDYRCNVSVKEVDPHNFREVSECVRDVAESQSVDGVVNFCGSIVLKPIHLTSYELFKETIDINLMTSFNLAHAVTTHIKKDCNLIFFSTAAAHIGLPNHESIASAKLAVEGLAKSLAASYAKANLRCNVIAPGLVDTPMSECIFRSEKAKEVSKSMHGLDRLGKPKDLVDCLLWMLSSDWMTGSVIIVDGGLSTVKGSR
jgi:3-oxoacyl-[acyl-carrier protein] reductase